MRSHRLTSLLVSTAVLIGATAGAAEIATIDDPGLKEISGIAAARSHDGFWVHNDSGDGPRLYAIDRQGRRLATVVLEGVRAVDCEDLAAGEIDGQRVLALGDIGDNAGIYPFRTIHLVAEPTIDAAVEATRARPVPVLRSLRFRYPDGPRDAEGLALDAAGGRLLVLAKRSDAPTLYQLPLHAPADGSLLVAQALTTLSLGEPGATLRAQKGRFAHEAHWPTALDLAPDGRALVVTTYVQALLWRRAADESWPEALKRTPHDLGIPVLRQTEAACFEADGAAVVATSEQPPAPLLRLTVPAP